MIFINLPITDAFDRKVTCSAIDSSLCWRTWNTFGDKICFLSHIFSQHHEPFFPLPFFFLPLFFFFFLWWDAASLSEGLEKKQARGWSPEQEIHQSVAFEQTITWPTAKMWRISPKHLRALQESTRHSVKPPPFSSTWVGTAFCLKNDWAIK